MNFVNFSDTATPIKMEGLTGMLNGYKVKSVFVVRLYSLM